MIFTEIRKKHQQSTEGKNVVPSSYVFFASNFFTADINYQHVYYMVKYIAVTCALTNFVTALIAVSTHIWFVLQVGVVKQQKAALLLNTGLCAATRISANAVL